VSANASKPAIRHVVTISVTRSRSRVDSKGAAPAIVPLHQDTMCLLHYSHAGAAGRGSATPALRLLAANGNPLQSRTKELSAKPEPFDHQSFTACARWRFPATGGKLKNSRASLKNRRRQPSARERSTTARIRYHHSAYRARPGVGEGV